MTTKDEHNFKHFLQVDRDGYFNAQGVRVEDDEAGEELFNNLTPFGTGYQWSTEMENIKAIVEPFDAIYIVQSLEKNNSEVWQINMPYKYKDQFNLNTLTLDEWDRFHGYSVKGVPFVFSRKAQAQFFDLLDEFDDDTITINGKTYTPKPWLNCEDVDFNPNNANDWSQCYTATDTPWDKGFAHPAIKDILPQIKFNRGRILVLGCGRGHDAAAFCDQGHFVTAVDFSSAAIDEAKKLYGDKKNLKFVQANALELPKEFINQFDMVFEHTLYCAISPEHRNQLVHTWKNALVENGYLLGFFYSADRTVGPPFGGSEWEVESRLERHFDFLFWTRWKNSVPKRQGTELIVYAQKKS